MNNIKEIKNEISNLYFRIKLISELLENVDLKDVDIQEGLKLSIIEITKKANDIVGNFEEIEVEDESDEERKIY